MQLPDIFGFSLPPCISKPNARLAQQKWGHRLGRPCCKPFGEAKPAFHCLNVDNPETKSQSATNQEGLHARTFYQLPPPVTLPLLPDSAIPDPSANHMARKNGPSEIETFE